MVSVADPDALPPGPVQVRVYVYVPAPASGPASVLPEVGCDPLQGPKPPLATQECALVEDHVSVRGPGAPGHCVSVGDMVMLTVGGGGVGGGLDGLPPEQPASTAAIAPMINTVAARATARGATAHGPRL